MGKNKGKGASNLRRKLSLAKFERNNSRNKELLHAFLGEWKHKRAPVTFKLHEPLCVQVGYSPIDGIYFQEVSINKEIKNEGK